MNPFYDSSGLLGSTEALRQRAEQDGYLYFRGLAPAGDVQNLRETFAEIVGRHGWLDKGANADNLLSTQEAKVEGMPEYWPVFDEFQRLESFHALAHSPPILRMLETLFGESVLVHPRNIGRIMFPSTPTTPPHQDFVHIQGTPDVWTAWIPLGDCPTELGGIAVLAGSHRGGVYPVTPMRGAGGVGVDDETIQKTGREWHASPFHIGDALFFHSQTVHKSLPNQTDNQMRLSVDYRYQAASKPVTEGSLHPHFGRFNWDSVYENWKSDRLKYYWKKFDLKIAPFERARRTERREASY